jgi:hypothetical protein
MFMGNTFGDGSVSTLKFYNGSNVALTLSSTGASVGGGLVTSGGLFGIGVTAQSDSALIMNNTANTASVSLKAPSTGLTSYSMTLPTAQGATNTTLINSDGAGTMTWGVAPSLIQYVLSSGSFSNSIPASTLTTISPGAISYYGQNYFSASGNFTNTLLCNVSGTYVFQATCCMTFSTNTATNAYVSTSINSSVSNNYPLPVTSGTNSIQSTITASVGFSAGSYLNYTFYQTTNSSTVTANQAMTLLITKVA